MKKLLFIFLLFSSVLLHGQEKKLTVQELEEQIVRLNSKLERLKEENANKFAIVEVRRTDLGRDISRHINFYSILLGAIVTISAIAVPLVINQSTKKKLDDMENINNTIKESLYEMKAKLKGVDSLDTEMKELKTSLSKAEKATEEASKEAQINSYISEFYYEQDVNKRILLCDMVLEINPNHAWIHVLKGNAYLDKKMYHEAMECYEEAKRLDKSAVWIYRYMGNIYYEQKEYKKALDNYNRALSLNPNYSKAYNNRGKLYLALAENEPNPSKKANYQKLADVDSKRHEELQNS